MSLTELTKKVQKYLEEHGLSKASTCQEWRRHEATKTTKSYWWNWFCTGGDWHGFHIYDDGKVEMVC